MDLSNGYKRLGDKACGGHGSCGQLLLVKDISSNRDALRTPIGSTRLWTDSGSGAHDDVAIYRLDAPSGYSCLGYAVRGYHDRRPTLDHFACVKNEYLSSTKFGNVIWEDSGSGVSTDFVAYSIRSPYGTLQSGCFIGRTNHRFSSYVDKSNWKAINADYAQYA